MEEDEDTGEKSHLQGKERDLGSPLTAPGSKQSNDFGL